MSELLKGGISLHYDSQTTIIMKKIKRRRNDIRKERIEKIIEKASLRCLFIFSILHTIY